MKPTCSKFQQFLSMHLIHCVNTLYCDILWSPIDVATGPKIIGQFGILQISLQISLNSLLFRVRVSLAPPSLPLSLPVCVCVCLSIDVDKYILYNTFIPCEPYYHMLSIECAGCGEDNYCWGPTAEDCQTCELFQPSFFI